MPPSNRKPSCLAPATGLRKFGLYGIRGGAERWLKIPLDLSQPRRTYAAQALSTAQRTPIVPFFGPTTGFVVNYTPDHAVRFNLEGSPIETLTHAYRPGRSHALSEGSRASVESIG